MGKLSSLNQNSLIRELFGKSRILIGHSDAMSWWHSECSFGKSMLNPQLRYSEKFLFSSVKDALEGEKKQGRQRVWSEAWKSSCYWEAIVKLLMRAHLKEMWQVCRAMRGMEKMDREPLLLSFSVRSEGNQIKWVRTQFKMKKKKKKEDLVLHTPGCGSV